VLQTLRTRRSGKHCAAVATAELFSLPAPTLACYAIRYGHQS